MGLVSRFFSFAIVCALVTVNSTFGVFLPPVSIPNPTALEEGQSPISASFPEWFVNASIQSLVENNPVLTSLDDVRFSAVNGLVTVRGKVVLPKGAVLQMEQILEPLSGGTAHVLEEFQFELGFIPKVKVLSSGTTFLSVTFTRLNLDGVEFVQSVPLVTHLANAILMSSKVSDFISDRVNAAPLPDVIQSSEDLGAQVADFLQRKKIRFSGASASLDIYLNLSAIMDLVQVPDAAEYLTRLDLGVWTFGPEWDERAQDSVFKIAVGNGAPSKDWQKANPTAPVPLAGEEFSASSASAYLDSAIDTELSRRGLDHVTIREEDELNRLRNVLLPYESREALDPKNPHYAANPELEFDRYLDSQRERIRLFVDDLERRHRFLRESREYDGGAFEQFHATRLKSVDDLNDNFYDAHPELNWGDIQPTKRSDTRESWSLAEQRVSQKLVNGVMNFARDMTLFKDSRFQNLSVILQPRLPGFVVRGDLAADLNKIAELGLEDKLAFNAGLYGDAIPFEIMIRTYLDPEGWLRIDAKSMKLFKGQELFVVDRHTRIGNYLVELVKEIIANSVAGMAMQPKVISFSKEASAKKNKNRQNIQTFVKNLESQYKELEGASLNPAIEELILTDVFNNPFLNAGKEDASMRIEAIFSGNVKYDDGSFLIALDPGIVAGSFPYLRDSVRLWNFEPVYSSQNKQVFLDLALGTGPRSAEYNEHLHTRSEYLDSQSYTAEDVGSETEPLDLRWALDLDDLTRAVNVIFENSVADRASKITEEMKKAKAQKHVRLRQVRFDVVEDDMLDIFVHVDVLEKSWDDPFFLWELFGADGEWEREEYDVKLRIRAALKTVALDDVRDQVKASDEQIFLGDQAIRLDITRAGFVYDKKGLIGTLLGVAGWFIDLEDINLKSDSFVVRAAKTIARWTLGPMLNDEENDGNTVLGTFHLNEFMKIFLPLGGEDTGDMIIQLNPRMTTPSFDLRIVDQQVRNGEKLGLVIDREKNRLRMDFRLRSGLTNTDKKEFLKIIESTEELFDEYLRADDAEELIALLSQQKLWTKAFDNSDLSKLSIYNRYMRIVGRYPSVVTLSESEFSKIAQDLYELLGVTNQEELQKKGNWISECGVELAYFVAAIYPLYDSLTLLIEKVQEFGLEGKLRESNQFYYDDFVRMKDQIRRRFLAPFVAEYGENYARKNRQILERGITDWTFKFYPDALFSYRTMARFQPRIEMLTPQTMIDLISDEEDNGASIRAAAARALPWLTSQSGALSAIESLKDPIDYLKVAEQDGDERVRIAVLRLYRNFSEAGAITRKYAIDAFIGELKDPSIEVRLAAVEELERIRSVEGLKIALKGNHASVQIQAVNSLGRLGPRAASALDSLNNLIPTSDLELQLAVERAIRSID